MNKERVMILGTGCAKCNKLEANVKTALTEMGRTDIEVGHVRDIMDIANYGVMMTPALAIDGKAVTAGKILSVEDAKDLLVKKL